MCRVFQNHTRSISILPTPLSVTTVTTATATLATPTAVMAVPTPPPEGALEGKVTVLPLLHPGIHHITATIGGSHSSFGPPLITNTAKLGDKLSPQITNVTKLGDKQITNITKLGDKPKKDMNKKVKKSMEKTDRENNRVSYLYMYIYTISGYIIARMYGVHWHLLL